MSEDERKAAELQRQAAGDPARLIDEAEVPSPSSAPSPAAERLRRLMPMRLVTSGPRPTFCSYRTGRGKRCDQVATWRERDGARGYCDGHRASVGLDDPR